jgi:ATP-binding protein involved in chromosome partitioning
MEFGFLTRCPAVLAVALLAWLLAFVGMLRSVARQLRAYYRHRRECQGRFARLGLSLREQHSHGIDRAGLLAALAGVQDPHTGKDFVSTRALRNVQISAATSPLTWSWATPPASPRAAHGHRRGQGAPAWQRQRQHHDKVVAHAVQRGVQLLPGVKNIIAVASGKGGVGKSTTAANLALALAAEGARRHAGRRHLRPQPAHDAGHQGRPESGRQDHGAAGRHGLQVMSIGFLVDEDQAMIWRGPMATQALEQLLRQTNWRTWTT